MAETGADLFTAHLNRKFAKRVKINIGIGFLVIVIFARILMNTQQADIWAVLCLIAGMIVCLWPAAVLFGARYPLRLTEEGVIAKYAIWAGNLIAWQDVLGIGVHPRRGNDCLIFRSGPSSEPHLLVIPWSMIEEPEQVVMGAIRRQLVLRGHRLVEPAKPLEEPASGPELVNPLKNFWS